MSGRRGGRSAANASRSVPPSTAPPLDQPLPAPPPARVTRSTTKSTAGTTTRSRKRTAPPQEEEVTQPRPQKTQRKITATVHNIPSTNTFPNAPHVYNPYSAYPSPGLSHNQPFTSAHPNTQPPPHVHTHAPPHHWTYAHVHNPSHSLPPGSHPPPYRPPSGHGSRVVIDAEDYVSDSEVEVGDFDDVTEEPPAVQFNPPKDLLQGRQKQNGPPRTHSHPHPNTLQRYSVQHVQSPHPSQPVPSRLVPQTPARLVSAPLVTVPRSPAPIPRSPAPVPHAPVHMVRFPTPTSEVPRPITPVQVIAPIALPNEKLDQRGSYPPAWQDLIDLATTFALHDMLFSNPFPSKEEALSYGGEAAGWAHSTYKQYHSTLLCSTSFNAHRSSIAKIALKAARGHRGRFRNLVQEIVYATKELGVSPKTAEITVAGNVDQLLFLNRFLDAPYAGEVRPLNAMYRSPVLKQAVKALYMHQPWARSMKLSVHTDSRWDLDPRPKGLYIDCPPISFVAFVATAYRNVLDSLRSGSEDLIAFSEADYGPVFDLLYDQIETDCNDPIHGEVVRERIEQLKDGVMFSQIPPWS